MKQNLMDRIDSVGKHAIEQWGTQRQMIKAAEECSELAVELCKMANNSPTPLSSVIDEIADVLITVSQMRTIFGEHLVDQRITYKLDRMDSALERTKGPASHHPYCDVDPVTGTWRKDFKEGSMIQICQDCRLKVLSKES